MLTPGELERCNEVHVCDQFCWYMSVWHFAVAASCVNLPKRASMEHTCCYWRVSAGSSRVCCAQVSHGVVITDDIWWLASRTGVTRTASAHVHRFTLAARVVPVAGLQHDGVLFVRVWTTCTTSRANLSDSPVPLQTAVPDCEMFLTFNRHVSIVNERIVCSWPCATVRVLFTCEMVNHFLVFTARVTTTPRLRANCQCLIQHNIT